MFDLSGKVALVTGSTTGLGKSMALHLGRAGAKVALNYAHNAARAEAALEAFRAEGLEAALFQASVVDPEDVLVLNATPDQPQRPIEQYDWAFHQQMLDFFVKSPYLLTRAVLPGMKRRRFGRIVNIGSEVYDRGVPNFSPYVAAKGAQRGWTRSMSQELAPYGITVNMISPGWIPVERHENDPEEMKRAYRELIPVQRWGKPEDIAAAAVYFASDEAGFVTGQTLVINGGMTVN